jgi:hypothetical protein
LGKSAFESLAERRMTADRGQPQATRGGDGDPDHRCALRAWAGWLFAQLLNFLIDFGEVRVQLGQRQKVLNPGHLGFDFLRWTPEIPVCTASPYPPAYSAIKATLPAASVIYPPERNDRGLDKRLNDPDLLLLSDKVVQILRKQNALSPILTLDKALHQEPRINPPRF